MQRTSAVVQCTADSTQLACSNILITDSWNRSGFAHTCILSPTPDRQHEQEHIHTHRHAHKVHAYVHVHALAHKTYTGPCE